MAQLNSVLDPPRTPHLPRTEPEAGPNQARERNIPWWPAGILVVVVLAVGLAFPGIRHQWALSFVRQPTHTTALSFQDAGHLPTTIGKDAPLHLSFTVANQEGRSIRYHYVVTSSSGKSGGKIIDRSTVSVPAGGTRSPSMSVNPGCAASPCRVQVALPGHGESIDLLLSVTTPSH